MNYRISQLLRDLHLYRAVEDILIFLKKLSKDDILQPIKSQAFQSAIIYEKLLKREKRDIFDEKGAAELDAIAVGHAAMIALWTFIEK